MQKPFLIVLIIAILGAVAIHFVAPELNAAVAFFTGAIIASVIFSLKGQSTEAGDNAASVEQYTGPTMTLYVGNLPYRVHEGEVKELFGKYGPVNSVRLVRDRKTGRRKGFGFIEMSEAGAQKAMSKLNEFDFQERTLKVREAKSQDSDKSERNENA
ncbi:RNA-binding protein [Shewanella benthica]|uniref:RNA-binding protein n=3 Tax=Shewanella TaxID=22 RepID=A0A330LYU5_9GAMM|nr:MULTISPECIES: RNA-binding protein [Shewanella]AQS40498.1 RNA recognition motif [Shewanella psychrophila]EDQ01438.1 RNA-binding protein [Shewanella benthica KT99]MBE7216744.1 RNA-binding protein [Shewanella benthica]MBL4814296.1 RNA-binding protein [Shewanella sp.]MCJ8302011.1 RNA-binding protein [Shewanella sp.]